LRQLSTWQSEDGIDQLIVTLSARGKVSVPEVPKGIYPIYSVWLLPPPNMAWHLFTLFLTPWKWSAACRAIAVLSQWTITQPLLQQVLAAGVTWDEPRGVFATAISHTVLVFLVVNKLRGLVLSPAIVSPRS
jgi:hypothetical protein